MIKYFNVFFDDGAMEFLDNLHPKVRKKILSVIYKSQFEKDPRLFKKITKELWEFRILFLKQQYRMLAFWAPDEKSLVVCTHGFIKTTKKTPLEQINRAGRIRKEYID